MPARKSTTSIVVVGGGFAGVRAALELGRALRGTTSTTITLITDSVGQEYHACFYEVATADTHDASTTSLRTTSCLSYDEIFSGLRVTVLRARVKTLDLEKKRVGTERGTVAYDAVIVALGSVTNYYGIRGLESNSIPLKSLRDALRIRQRVGELLKMPRKGPLNIVIGGGGQTGSELAGELVGYVKRMSWRLRRHSRAASITLVEATPQLMPGMSLGVAQTVESRLKTLGVKVMVGTAVKSVNSTSLEYVVGKTSGKLPHDLLIWTGGIQAPALVRALQWPKNPRGQVLVSQTLMVPRRDGVFVVGDAAAVIQPNGKPVPATATAAIDQGAMAARNALHWLRKESLETYSPRQARLLMPVAGHYAIADFRLVRFTGLFGWFLRRWWDLSYFRSVLPLRRAFQLWWRGSVMYLKNDR